MFTNYFYCRLVPTIVGNPYHFTAVFMITYASDGDCNAQQNQFETQYRTSIGNPLYYNSGWSPGDSQVNAQETKDSDIQNIEANGNQIIDDGWQP